MTCKYFVKTMEDGEVSGKLVYLEKIALEDFDTLLLTFIDVCRTFKAIHSQDFPEMEWHSIHVNGDYGDLKVYLFSKNLDYGVTCAITELTIEDKELS